MSVRAVPKNYRNVTGVAASKKADGAYFESTLERDLLTLLEFDLMVDSFEVQPIRVNWYDENNKTRTYTPDVLVFYRKDIESVANRKPLLIEVKYREDLKKDWANLKPKFLAAVRYAKSRGWRFKLLTEVEIRTTYMENAKFLLPYLHQYIDDAFEIKIFDKLKDMREATPESIIKAIFKDKWNQAELIPTIWQMIAQRKIGTDLSAPLTMTSAVWSNY